MLRTAMALLYSTQKGGKIDGCLGEKIANLGNLIIGIWYPIRGNLYGQRSSPAENRSQSCRVRKQSSQKVIFYK